MNYDLIGDIHGHADKLEALLIKLGYQADGEGYRAPQGRQAIFLGDLIDRGPKQLRVLEIVRGMVDSDSALCIMGNHEFNAIAYFTEDPSNPGECYRPNRQNSKKALKNRKQHEAFLQQVGEGSDEHAEWVEWFKTLPVCLDLGGLRAVHGCWDQDSVEALYNAGWRPGEVLNDQVFDKLHLKNPDGSEGELMRARKLLTCGLEIPLPDGVEVGKDEVKFKDLRIANWRHWGKSLAEVALVPGGVELEANKKILDELDWPADLVLSKVEGSPVFLGHHWFSGHPVIESPKLACLDWSAAKGGPLVAYRWDGEQELSDDKLVWVNV